MLGGEGDKVAKNIMKMNFSLKLSLNRCETGTFVHTGVCLSFFVCFLSPLV
jgi:hypothetical protein